MSAREGGGWREQVEELPSFSATLMELLSLIDGGKIALSALDRHVSQDPGLAVQVIRLANSSFYGQSGRIETLGDACVVLGIHTIRNLIITTMVMRQFPEEDGNHLDRRRLWAHARATAVAAGVIAPRCRIPAGSAFVAGLMHDLGKLVIDAYLPEVAARITARQAEGVVAYRAEREILGDDHAAVGAVLARQWRFPDLVVDAIAHHHHPERAGGVSAALVHVADLLVRGIGLGERDDAPLSPLSPAALARCDLSLTGADLIPVLQEIEAQYGLMTA